MPRHQTKRPEMMQLEMLAASFDAQVSVVGELWITGLCPCQPALPTSGELPRKAYSAITGELLNLLLPWELPGPWSAWGEGGIGSFRAESSSSMLAFQGSLSDTHLCLPAGVNECPAQRKEHSNLRCSRKEQPAEWNLPLLSNLCGGEWYELGENIPLPQSISLHWEIAVYAVIHLMYNTSLFFTISGFIPPYLWDRKYHAVTTAVLTLHVLCKNWLLLFWISLASTTQTSKFPH